MRAMRLMLLAVAATVVFLVGCGAAENDPNLAAAAEKTEALGSGRFEIKGSAEGSGKPMSLSCTGEADYDRKRVHVRCEYQGAGVLEAIAIPNDVYLRGDAAFGSGTSDKWAKETADVFDDDSLLANFSPQHLFSLLRRASTVMERIGDEDVRGEVSTRYRLTVDCESASLNCDSTAPVDVWIADDGTVRRIALDDDDGEVTFEFFDFGADVDIEAPPADQILHPEQGSSGFSSGLGAASCSGLPGAPITEEEAIRVLRRHGFSVSRDGQQLCNADFDSTMLSNTVNGSPQDVIGREGYLGCTVIRLKPGAGSGKKLVGVEGEGISAQVDFENVRCTLFAEGPSEAEKVAGLHDAFAELKRTKH
jgi:hypothetical protein